MPLVFAPVNTQLKVVKVIADERTKKFLESLGIVCGEDISVLNAGGGSVVCKIKGGRVAIDGGVSSKILVRCAG